MQEIILRIRDLLRYVAAAAAVAVYVAIGFSVDGSPGALKLAACIVIWAILGFPRRRSQVDGFSHGLRLPPPNAE
jgi:hypothetical protein